MVFLQNSLQGTEHQKGAGAESNGLEATDAAMALAAMTTMASPITATRRGADVTGSKRKRKPGGRIPAAGAPSMPQAGSPSTRRQRQRAPEIPRATAGVDVDGQQVMVEQKVVEEGGSDSVLSSMRTRTTKMREQASGSQGTGGRPSHPEQELASVHIPGQMLAGPSAAAAHHKKTISGGADGAPHSPPTPAARQRAPQPARPRREALPAGGGGGVVNDIGLAVASNLPPLTQLPAADKDWLEVLTTTDRFFKVCGYCGGGLTPGMRPSNGGRDALAAILDLDAPHLEGVCAHCKTERTQQGHRLLQIRRSTYHDVVKMSDLMDLQINLAGVQGYSINNARVVFLQPRPQSSCTPKTPAAAAAVAAAMPSRCVLDGRQLMDTGSCYCCLRCKVDVELHGVVPNMTADPLATYSLPAAPQVPAGRQRGYRTSPGKTAAMPTPGTSQLPASVATPGNFAVSTDVQGPAAMDPAIQPSPQKQPAAPAAQEMHPSSAVAAHAERGSPKVPAWPRQHKRSRYVPAGPAVPSTTAMTSPTMGSSAQVSLLMGMEEACAGRNLPGIPEESHSDATLSDAAAHENQDWRRHGPSRARAPTVPVEEDEGPAGAGPDEPPEIVGPNPLHSVSWHPTHGPEAQMRGDDELGGRGTQEENDEMVAGRGLPSPPAPPLLTGSPPPLEGLIHAPGYDSHSSSSVAVDSDGGGSGGVGGRRKKRHGAIKRASLE